MTDSDPYARQKKWARENPEKVREISRRGSARARAKDPEKHNRYQRDRRLKDPETFRQKQKIYRDANPEKFRAWRLKKSYGITSEDWQSLFASQGNSCAVCKRQEPDTKQGWHVDHCHGTGRVRGILCRRCNLLLGHGGDDPAVLRCAADYLEHHSDE